jgi:hypothetical protein
VSSWQNKKFNVAFTASGAKERLSLARCREILGNDCPESDADLERLRDQLYGFARVVAETLHRQPRKGVVPRPLNDAGGVFEGETGQSPQPSFSNVLATLPDDERYALEERAGIHEDSGLDRSAAECAAFSEFWRKRHRV